MNRTVGSSQSFLRNVSLFAALDDAQLKDVARLAVPRTYPRETTVLREGDRGEALYLIQEGRVKVLLSAEKGREVIVSILAPGQCFGEMALVDSSTRCARVVTMTDCRFQVISGADYTRLLTSSPEIAIAMLRELAGRLRSANRSIGSLATLDVFGRVARFLLDAATEVKGQIVVEELPTQTDIAAIVGASREMVNRAMRELNHQGFITQHGKRVVITDKMGTVW